MTPLADTVPAEMLPTPRLLLRRASIGRLSALISGAAEYERVFGHGVAAGFIEYPDMLVYCLQQAQAQPADQGWWLPYLIEEAAGATLTGVCGYKGPPDLAGYVEIGYGIAPGWRNRGLVTEAALALTTHALGVPGIAGVYAHTLPQPSASTRVLTKCGFHRAGGVDDPEEGWLWRWEQAAPR